MPDTRRHRGPHPEDARLFAPSVMPVLNQATGHLSWLLTRGYASRSALKLVGDRFQLEERQRRAVLRSACSDQARVDRKRRQVEVSAVRDQTLDIDGFNVITTIEAASSGGVLILGRDGCCRDMASMHGSYRKVAETRPALELIGRVLESVSAGPSTWWLDRPVSNSGRLAKLIESLAAEHGWPWQAQLANDPDVKLIRSTRIVVSADSVVLDRCTSWFNLALLVVQRQLPEVQLVNLDGNIPKELSNNDLRPA